MGIELLVIAVLCAVSCWIGVYFSTKYQKKAEIEAFHKQFNDKKKQIQAELDEIVTMRSDKPASVE